MRWDDVRLVLAVAEAAGLTDAAKALDLNHSTVYRRLMAVEEAAGARLFVREGGVYRATPLGEQVVSHARAMADQMTALMDAVHSRDGEPRGTVRLTAPESALALLGGRLADFQARYPLVQVQGDFSDRFFELAAREVDVAVRFTRALPPDAVGRRVAAVAWAVYAPIACPAPTQLPWAGFTAGRALAAAEWLRGRGVTPVMTVNSVPALEQVLCAGEWQGTLPCFVGDANPRLQRLGEAIPDAVSELWILYHQALWQTRRVRALVEHLAAGLAEHVDLFEGRGQRD